MPGYNVLSKPSQSASNPDDLSWIGGLLRSLEHPLEGDSPGARLAAWLGVEAVSVAGPGHPPAWTLEPGQALRLGGPAEPASAARHAAAARLDPGPLRRLPAGTRGGPAGAGAWYGHRTAGPEEARLTLALGTREPLAPAETLALEDRLQGIGPVLAPLLRQHAAAAGARGQAARYRSALDRLNVAVFFCGADGAVSDRNGAAAAFLEMGRPLVLRGRRLAARREAEQAALAAALKVAGGGPGRAGAGLRLGGDAEAPLPVAVLPAGPEAADGVLLIPLCSAEPLPDPALLRDLFRLTPAEAEIARGLAAGRRLDEIADARGVSMNTLRTQLRALLDKVGCSRQADLVQVLTGLSLVRLPPGRPPGPA